MRHGILGAAASSVFANSAIAHARYTSRKAIISESGVVAGTLDGGCHEVAVSSSCRHMFDRLYGGALNINARFCRQAGRAWFLGTPCGAVCAQCSHPVICDIALHNVAVSTSTLAIRQTTMQPC